MYRKIAVVLRYLQEKSNGQYGILFVRKNNEAYQWYVEPLVKKKVPTGMPMTSCTA